MNNTIDIELSPADFTKTTVTVTAISGNAKALFSQVFGAGAVSAELPKSELQRFSDFAHSNNLVTR